MLNGKKIGDIMDNKRKYAHFLLDGCLNLNKESKLFIIGVDIIDDFITNW